MHYCQRCDTAVPMRPREDVAVCPRCAWTEPARRAPLFVVTGASGSGKTATFPHLVQALPDCAVFDVDWLIDPFERAGAPGPLDWPAFRDAWLSVAHGVAQGGRCTVLLGPFQPGQLTDLPARQWIQQIHFAVLDCGDDTRRARLTSRPPWRERAVEEHVAFAAYLRKTITTVVSAEDDPERVARRLAQWVLAHLPRSRQR